MIHLHFSFVRDQTDSGSSWHTFPKLKKKKKNDSLTNLTIDSSHDESGIRPIGRLLQLNPDGTQLVELIQPEHGELGVHFTQSIFEGQKGGKVYSVLS